MAEAQAFVAPKPEALLANVEDPRALYDQTIATLQQDGLATARLEINNAMGNVTEKLSDSTPVDAPRHRLFGNIADSMKGLRGVSKLAAFGSAVVLAACGGKGETTTVTTTTPATPSGLAASKDTGKCAPTWQRSELKDNDKNRFLEKGLPVIKKADTKAEAREAVNQWWKVVRGDTEVSATLAEKITKRSVTESKLFDKEGCATAYADSVNDRVIATLAISDISPGQAPKNGTNTGLHRGDIVQNSRPGVSGDRTAANVTLPDGEKFSVLSRCAQPVFEGSVPGVPTGPTDQPEPRIKFQPRPDRNIPGRPAEGCPPGTVAYLQRCVHKAANRAPAEANQGPHKENDRRTPGYNTGNAKNVTNSQDSQPAGGLNPTPHGTQAGGPGSSPGGGEGSVVTQPGPSAPANPAYNPNAPVSPGTSAGTSNPATSPAAQTEATGQTSGAGSDPGAP